GGGFAGPGAEGAAGGCKDDLFDAVPGSARAAYGFAGGGLRLTDQTLPDGRVLAVDGTDANALAAGEVRDDFARHHECLFIGEGYLFACFQGRKGGGEPCVAGGGDHYDVNEIGRAHV